MNWLYELGASSDRKVIIGVVSVSTVNTLRGDVEFVGEQARQMKAGHAAKGFSLTLFRSFYFFLWRKETKQRDSFSAKLRIAQHDTWRCLSSPGCVISLQLQSHSFISFWLT